MSKNADEDQIKDRLEQLRCHFTWELVIIDTEMPDLETRVLEEIKFLDTKYKVGIYNLLAYVKHLGGQNEEALKSLKEAEDSTQQEDGGQSDVRSLVTWGNYAWLYYRMGQQAEAQIYLDKVKNTCRKLANPSSYRMECPQMDCEEGWALLKCGGKNYERAKVCFEKALAVEPENPEFSTGYAITVYRLDGFNRPQHFSEFCLNALKQAVRLNPKDAYIKALLALKLQDAGQEAAGEEYIKEALTSTSSEIYVFRHAAKFYRRKGSLDDALKFSELALSGTPSSAFLHHQIGLCYKSKMIQIKKAARNWQPKGQDKENFNRQINLAKYHFEFAVKQKPTFEIAYISLAEMYAEAGEYRKAEDAFQKVLSLKTLDEDMLQQVHSHYGRFLEFHKKSEVDAISHYLKAVKIEKASFERDKSITALEKLASKKLRRNASDIESLSILGLTHKLKGEMNEALEYYEQALRLALDSENSVGHVL